MTVLPVLQLLLLLLLLGPGRHGGLHCAWGVLAPQGPSPSVAAVDVASEAEFLAAIGEPAVEVSVCVCARACACVWTWAWACAWHARPRVQVCARATAIASSMPITYG